MIINESRLDDAEKALNIFKQCWCYKTVCRDCNVSNEMSGKTCPLIFFKRNQINFQESSKFSDSGGN